LQRRFDEELLSFLASERPHLEAEAHPLLDEIESLIAAGGKRMRPRFCYWGHIAGGGSDGVEIYRAGAALELLHTFAIIHDDVMDRSRLRRSRHSTFMALAELSRRYPHRGDPRRFGTSAALLTGLLGFVLADRLLQTSGFPPEVMGVMNERFDRMRTRAIAGQYLDLLAAHRGEADEETARRIGALKSGSYSVVDPLVIGALAARADDEMVRALEAYGSPLGEAFQIADDVLGVFGDPEVTGKDRDGDLREGKQTVLLARARKMTTGRQRRFLEEKVGDPELGPQDADRVRELIATCGALDATRQLMAELSEQALGALDKVTDARAADALRELAGEATARDA
jgi:geranylgeranyl diphosphate synthase type I